MHLKLRLNQKEQLRFFCCVLSEEVSSQLVVHQVETGAEQLKATITNYYTMVVYHTAMFYSQVCALLLPHITVGTCGLIFLPTEETTCVR